jgi:hypothetical protein
MVRSFLLMLSLLQVAINVSQAQTTTAPDTPEAGSAEAIAAATGDPRFLSPWVAYLPKSATFPLLSVSLDELQVLRANSWTAPKPTPTVVLSPAHRRGCVFSPSVAVKKGATS